MNYLGPARPFLKDADPPDHARETVYPCLPVIARGAGKHRFTIRPATVFRPRHFTIESTIAPFFLVHDVRVHRYSAFRSSDPMPGSCFTPAHRVDLSYDTCILGGELEAVVSRRPMRIVCQKRDAGEFPPIEAIEPAALRCLHPWSGRSVGSIDLFWDGWPIPEWCDAHVSDCYARIADITITRKTLVSQLEALILEGSATGQLDSIKSATLLSDVLAFEEKLLREPLADYSGEPFRSDLEFRAWFEGIDA